MKRLSILMVTLLASPAAAATGPFFSLANTNFVVLLAFILFLGVLLYYKVPQRVGKMLDDRATGIRDELDEARSVREEAQELLASYERKQREVSEQSERIVTHAREEAKAAAEQSQRDLEASIDRRMRAAEEQIASAEGKAVREVRERAIRVAVAAAGEVVAKQMTAAEADRLIDQSIDTVDRKLH